MKRKTWTAFAFMAAMLALSACGSSSSSTSTSAPSTSSAGSSTPASTPSGSAIVVGSICACSGPEAAVLGDDGKVSQAWAASVNAAGGINGHPVKMIVMDDGGDPAKGLQDAKQLVEGDHVVAIVGDNDSLADSAWAPYVASKGIPVVGGISVLGPAFSNPDWFSTGPGLPEEYIAMMALAKAAGAHKIGTGYCAEAPACKQADQILKPAAAAAGLGYTSLAVSGTAPSYAAPCLTLKGAGADAIYPALNAQVAQRLVDACAQQGFTPTDLNTSTSVASNWLTDPKMDGTQLIYTNPLETDASNPAVKQLLDALDKYEPGTRTNAEFGYLAFYGWIAGKLFEAAAKAADIGPTSTPADVKRGLYALKGETLGGLAVPLTFKQGQPSLVTCYWTASLKGGKIAYQNGGKYTCLTPTQVTLAKKFS